MFTFLYNAIRLSAYALLVLTAIAAGIGRSNPPPPIPRMPRPALEVEARHEPSYWRSGYGLRDPATGRLEHFAAPGGHRLNHASCSPWRDPDGRSQMVAQWMSFEGRDSGAMPSGSGIARYSIPDGEILDRVDLDAPPTSPPCWYPGTEARILYTAGNGWLYHYNFDEPGNSSGGDGGNQPRPLDWPDRPPGLERIIIHNLTWPDDPRLRGRFIVAMSQLEVIGESRRFTPSKLWWLQLDPGGTMVQAAGRLTVPPANEEGFDERRPNVTTAPDGGLVLSYTAGLPGTPRGRPRLVTIAFDPATHAPIALLTASDAPSEDGPRIASRPSADGRRVGHTRGARVR